MRLFCCNNDIESYNTGTPALSFILVCDAHAYFVQTTTQINTHLRIGFQFRQKHIIVFA